MRPKLLSVISKFISENSVKLFFESRVFLLISCAAIFFSSVFFRSIIDIGPDTGFYLLLGKKIANGGKYYYDFFESNFPLSFYFYALQYKLSELIHLNQIILSEIVINLLALLSIFWSAKILRNSEISQNKLHYNFILIAFFLGFFLRPLALMIGEFGTKTSLLLILFFPYISYSFSREIALTKKDLLYRGMLMGLMPCLKPHYLILILFVEIHRFWQKKNFKFFLAFIPSGYGNATQVAPHTCGEPHPYVKGTYGFFFELDKLVMMLIGAIYLFLMMKFTPEFFEFMVPMWSKIYSAYESREVFLKNILHLVVAKGIIFIFIFLIFSRLKPDKNDKILLLFFISGLFLIMAENISTIDQIVVFYAIVTICFAKLMCDMISAKLVNFSQNKFIIITLIILPIFDMEVLPLSIFSVGGFVNVWWILALLYPFIFAKKITSAQRQEWFTKRNIFILISLYLLLLSIAILALIKLGGEGYLTTNLTILFVVLFFFERNFYSKISSSFSPLSVFVIFTSISCLLYFYISSIAILLHKQSDSHSDRKLSEAIFYYSKVYAPQKDQEFLMSSILLSYQFPAINYLEKTPHSKFFINSPSPHSWTNREKLMPSISDKDRIFTLNYFLDDIKSRLKDSRVKVIFINNSKNITELDKRCTTGYLEDYFLDPEFRKIFLHDFHFQDRFVISRKIRLIKNANFTNKEEGGDIFDNLPSSDKKIFYDFEVYVRNEKN